MAPAEIEEFRCSSDLALRASKQVARAIGHSLAAFIVMERHLWLNLSRLEEKDRSFLLDAPVSPPGLFGAAVEMVVLKFREAKVKSAAFKRYIPRLRKRPSALAPLPVRRSEGASEKPGCWAATSLKAETGPQGSHRR